MVHKRLKRRRLLVLIVLALSMSAIAACAQSSESGADRMDGGGTGDMEHNMDGDSAAQMIPNNGAVITIVSPENGATFAAGEDILVVVEIENFELNVDGTHWHVYVDGVSFGMVMGNTTKQVLRNLEPGEHVIMAHLANGVHEELEVPGMVNITVTE